MRRSLVTAFASVLLMTQVMGASASTPPPAPAPVEEHTHDEVADSAPTPRELPAEDPARGVVTDGLVAARSGACVGMLEITGVAGLGTTCTHGPDAAPAEAGDVRTGDLDQAEAQRVAEAAPPFVCDGDGTEGRRVQAIYAVAPDRTDRFSQYESTFKGIVAGVQDVVRDSSVLHGAEDPLVFRFAHTPPSGGVCEPTIEHVRFPSTADDDSFGATINALTDLGYTDPSRRYLVFVDANVMCGIAQLYGDDRASAGANWNNVLYTPLFSRVDTSCWNYAETHELAHTIGAVQDSAPNATGMGHCNDDHDLLCYSDGGPNSNLRVEGACPSSTWERLLDCGGNDYFNPSPAPGSYLDTHWNIANSGWLFPEPVTEQEPGGTGGGTGGTGGTGDAGTGGTGGTGGAGTGSRAPSVAISAPSTTLVNTSVRVSGSASDADGDLRSVRLYIDGRLTNTLSTTGSWARTVSLSVGQHTIAVVAVDAGGRTSVMRSVEVMALGQMPNPVRDLFRDDNDSMFENDIARLAVQGVTKGCNPPTNDRFCPDAPVTRGVMAAFLVRALGLPAGSGVSFTDDNNSMFEADIEKLAAAGITRGCNPPSNTRFCPNDPVTRGQMAAFLSRALSLPTARGIDFTDDNRSVFEADIEKLAAAGITRGCNPPNNTRFCPDGVVTRGQMAAFLTRALYS